MTSIARENYLSELKEIDWDFSGENGTDGFAAYHWYPARYIPQLPGILIGYFSTPGEVVLDPFMGSGTTLLEAWKLGRRAIGVELNPVAVMIAQAKLFAPKESFISLRGMVEQRARGLLVDPRFEAELPSMVPHFDENVGWYHPDTLLELAAIWTALGEVVSSEFYVVGIAAFSAILRYASSQEKHWGWICDNVKPKQKTYRTALKRFIEKLNEFERASRSLLDDGRSLQESAVLLEEIMVKEGDCATVLAGLPDESVDLVVTSPPYYNMTDYISSQRLTHLWSDNEVDSVRLKEIGARFKRFRKTARAEYLDNMVDAFREIHRVLRRHQMCCVVIGESPSHAPVLSELEARFAELGFSQEAKLTRQVRKRRSLSPVLHSEEIILMRKG